MAEARVGRAEGDGGTVSMKNRNGTRIGPTLNLFHCTAHSPDGLGSNLSPATHPAADQPLGGFFLFPTHALSAVRLRCVCAMRSEAIRTCASNRARAVVLSWRSRASTLRWWSLTLSVKLSVVLARPRQTLWIGGRGLNLVAHGGAQ